MNDRARILVVDDEPQLIRVLRTGLKSRGYDVRGASDGEIGLETFSEWHPDLVITDLAMPNVDGLEFCRRLRAISQVPIIVLSAKGEEKTKVEALDIGADDFVTKPFGIDELLARVRASLRRANAPPISDETQVILDVGARPALSDPLDFERLYALGIDAFRLALALLKGDADVPLDGVTGHLRLGPDQRYVRELTGAQFAEGQLKTFAGKR